MKKKKQNKQKTVRKSGRSLAEKVQQKPGVCLSREKILQTIFWAAGQEAPRKWRVNRK